MPSETLNMAPLYFYRSPLGAAPMNRFTADIHERAACRDFVNVRFPERTKTAQIPAQHQDARLVGWARSDTSITSGQHQVRLLGNIAGSYVIFLGPFVAHLIEQGYKSVAVTIDTHSARAWWDSSRREERVSWIIRSGLSKSLKEDQP